MSEEIKTFDDVLAENEAYRSEFDRRVSKAISTVQAKLDAEVKKNSGLPSADEISALTKERDSAKNDLTAAQAKILQYERERYLISKGVPADDVDYYAYKASKLVTADKTFEQAADELIKAKSPQKAKVDLGAPMNGGKPKSNPNDVMNALIRGAGK